MYNLGLVASTASIVKDTLSGGMTLVYRYLLRVVDIIGVLVSSFGAAGATPTKLTLSQNDSIIGLCLSSANSKGAMPWLERVVEVA